VVSLSVASAEHLHVLAHRAALAARDYDDWWDSPLETALAAANLVRHTHAHWPDAERALARLLRWWREEGPRRTSADAAALALAAWTAGQLERPEPDLVSDAITAVAGIAERDLPMVPLLHVVMCVWAMDSLVVDRNESPWPSLRARIDRLSHPSLNEPLRQYAYAVASKPLHPRDLLNALLTSISGAAEPSEACVLIWLITVTVEKISDVASARDDTYGLLITKRCELTERLCGEIDERTFADLEPLDFDMEEPDFYDSLQGHLSSFEAILLDFSLASRDAAHPWLTFEEAAALFDRQAAEERSRFAAESRRLLLMAAGLVSLIGVSASATLWQTLRSVGVKESVAYPGAIGLLCLGQFAAVRLAFRRNVDSEVAEAAAIFFVSLSILSGFVSVNQSLRKPFIADIGGLVVATVIAGASALFWVLVKNWRRRR
jgi:hypothetical protein